jgi:hypothetical protein
MQEIKKMTKMNLDALTAEQLILLLSNICYELPQLTEANFPDVAVNLVRYGMRLYVENKKAPSDVVQGALKFLEGSLHRIQVLNPVNSLERLDLFYRKFRASIMAAEKYVVINNKDRSFTDYYFIYRINQDLQNPGVDTLSLSEWLLRFKPEHVHQNNYSRVIREAVVAFPDGKMLCQFLKNFAQSVMYRKLAMQEGLRHVHLPLISELLNEQLYTLPTDISCYEGVLPCLVAANEVQLLSKIEAIFGHQAIFDYALTHFDYKIVAHYLLRVKLPADILAFKKVVAIAACCGDVQFINSVLEKYPKNNSEFFQLYVAPLYQPMRIQKGDNNPRIKKIYGDNQDLYQIEFSRMAGILVYFKKQDLFTYSFSEEQKSSLLLGPVRIGYLRKIMAFSMGYHTDSYQFGSVRDGGVYTHRGDDGIDYYFKECQQFFNELATLNPDDINHAVLDDKSPILEYVLQVKLGDSDKVTRLTCYRGSLDTGVAEWVHTECKYFNAIAEHIQAVDRKLRSLNSADVVILEKLLRGLAKIQFYHTQATFYERGSAAVCELIAHANFKIAKLLYPSQITYRPDCFGLMNMDEDKYVESYPTIFGVKTYQELIQLLSPPFAEYQQLDRIAYDVNSNKILQLSTLQQAYRTKKDQTLPKANTMLRRVAGFHSPGQLQQLLYFVIDLDEQDSGEYARTALHWAIAKGRVDNAKVLIDAGASADIPDTKQMTSRHYITESENVEINALLQWLPADRLDFN